MRWSSVAARNLNLQQSESDHLLAAYCSRCSHESSLSSHAQRTPNHSGRGIGGVSHVNAAVRLFHHDSHNTQLSVIRAEEFNINYLTYHTEEAVSLI